MKITSEELIEQIRELVADYYDDTNVKIQSIRIDWETICEPQLGEYPNSTEPCYEKIEEITLET